MRKVRIRPLPCLFPAHFPKMSRHFGDAFGHIGGLSEHLHDLSRQLVSLPGHLGELSGAIVNVSGALTGIPGASIGKTTPEVLPEGRHVPVGNALRGVPKNSPRRSEKNRCSVPIPWWRFAYMIVGKKLQIHGLLI